MPPQPDDPAGLRLIYALVFVGAMLLAAWINDGNPVWGLIGWLAVSAYRGDGV